MGPKGIGRAYSMARAAWRSCVRSLSWRLGPARPSRTAGMSSRMCDEISRHRSKHVEIPDPDRFGQRVQRLRRELGLDRQQLADRTGLSEKILRDIEQGRRSRRQEHTLIALAAALGVPFETLVHGDRVAREPAEAAASTRDRRRWLGSSLVAAVLAATLAVVLVTGSRDPEPLPGLTLDEHRLLARSPRTGETIWSLDAGSRVVFAHPLPWNEELVLVGLGREGADWGWIRLLDRRTGDARWAWRPAPDQVARLFEDPDLAVDAGFAAYDACFPDLDGDGRGEIVVNVMHNRWYPSGLIHLDDDGRVTATYWSSGRIYDPLVSDLDGDGKDEMVWTATNNTPIYQGASVILFDDVCRHGATLDAGRGGRTDVPDSSRARVILPAYEAAFMDHLEVFRLKAVAPQVRVTADGERRIEVVVHGRGDDGALVTLTDDLRPLSAVPTDQLKRALGQWLAGRGAAANDTAIQAWLDRWLERAVRFEAGHWPPDGVATAD
ncbi:helix-turn-helix domain-containing protein [bacterium]|nr:helix-turn-helix domain-containing protein [bacterium]